MTLASLRGVCCGGCGGGGCGGCAGYFIHLFPHDEHAELTHDDFEWGAGLPKRMLVKEKHLAMLPEWTWNGLDPPQQQALREVWCRNRHFAEVTAAGQLVMRVGRREVIA